MEGMSSTFSRFAYPVIDDNGVATNRGRLVWKGRDPAAPTQGSQNMFFAMDFSVQAANISFGPAHRIADYGDNTSVGGGSACCGIDISADGRTLYMSAMPVLRPEGYVHSIARASIPANLEDLAELPTPVTVFEHPPTPTDLDVLTADMSVDENGDFLYLFERVNSGGRGRLLRVDLDPDLVDTLGNVEVKVLAGAVPGPESVATDLSGVGSDLIALANYSSSLNCNLLVVMNGRTGSVLNEGTAWLTQGGQFSWYGGKVLSSGAAAGSKRSLGCRSTDWIVTIDPLSGVNREIVTGRSPDGR
jgi:hypothetical protein